MSSRAAFLVGIGPLTVALGYAVLNNGGFSRGDTPFDANLALLLIGLAAAVSVVFHPDSLPRLRGVALRAALLVPSYVALQLVPLPLFFLRILSPARAQISASLGALLPVPSFAPLAVTPTATVVELSRIVCYALVFFLVAGICQRSRSNTWAPVVPLIAIAALEAAVGLMQYAAGSEIVLGTYPDRDLFAGLLELLLPFPIMYALAILGREKLARLSLAAVLKASGLVFTALAIFLAIVFSFSRMGFLAALGSLLIMGAAGFGSRLQGWRRWSALAALCAAAVYLLIFLPPNELVEQFGKAIFEPTGGRGPIWKDTLHLIAAYPWFGCGLGSYGSALPKYETARLNLGWTHAHNDYFQLLAELGIAGFLIAAAWMAAVSRRALHAAVSRRNREVRLLGLACCGSLAALMLHSLTEFNLYIPATAIALAWISGIAVSLPALARSPEPEDSAVERPFLRRAVIVSGGLLAFYSGAWLVFLFAFHHDPRAELAFCRLGICDTDTARAALLDRHGGNIAAVPRSALLEFLRRDPAGPGPWRDLAEASERSGQTEAARSCYLRAVLAGPNIPYTLFAAANFHFTMGETRPALELMARALNGDSDYETAAFDQYQRRQIPVDDILRYGLPELPRAFRSYLHSLLPQNRAAEAATTFAWMVPRGYVDIDAANEYLYFLIGKRTPEAAVAAWTRWAGARSKDYPQTNRVFNGDFESDPVRSPFDWSLQSTPAIQVAIDPQVAHSGSRSLRIHSDDAESPTYVALTQSVLLSPGSYRLRAWVKTDLTAGSITLRIQPLNVKTENVTGASPWKLVEQEFQVTGTAMVEVHTLVSGPIRGTAWIDEISITCDGNRIQ
jgi:O-antigen ligase